MKVIIIGSVAAGTSAAAKIRRNDETVEVVVYDKGKHISYSACGIPYYIGTEMDISQLTPRDEKWFKDRFEIDIFTSHEVETVDYENKKVQVKNLKTGEKKEDQFDKLIFATGAVPFKPQIPGVEKENVFVVRNIDNAIEIKDFITTKKPSQAVIVGSGFIGMEMIENLLAHNIEVTMVEMLPQVASNLDRDVAIKLENYLKEEGINLYIDNSITEIKGDGLANRVKLASGKELETELVIMATGIRPNTELAEEIGVDLGVTGAIKVNKKLETNLQDIYAIGDCAQSFSRLTGEPSYHPLGTVANKMGRIVGDQITGGDLIFQGTLGTGIFKVLDLTVGHTGLTEVNAKKAGYEVETAFIIKPNQPKYYPGGEKMLIKAVADKKSNKLLGVQIIGKVGVDKRIDVFATALTYGAKVDELFELDLSYAPPFATTKDPVLYSGMILNNSLNRGRKLITPAELKTRKETGEEFLIIDVRREEQYQKHHVKGAINIPLSNIRAKIKELDKEKTVVTYCNKGTSGNAAQNILLNSGFEKVYNLAGGHQNYLLQETL